MDQNIINGLGGLALLLIGWCLRVMWESITHLRQDDAKLTEKVGAIEVLVAGEYVKRDYFENKMDALFAKVDKIFEKLDGKADK